MLRVAFSLSLIIAIFTFVQMLSMMDTYHLAQNRLEQAANLNGQSMLVLDTLEPANGN